MDECVKNKCSQESGEGRPTLVAGSGPGRKVAAPRCGSRGQEQLQTQPALPGCLLSSFYPLVTCAADILSSSA